MATKGDSARQRRWLEREQCDILLQAPNGDRAQVFHALITGATRNHLLQEIVNAIWQRQKSSALWQQFHGQMETSTLRLRWLGDQQKILAALRWRDMMGSEQSMWQSGENVKPARWKFATLRRPNSMVSGLNRCRFYRGN